MKGGICCKPRVVRDCALVTKVLGNRNFLLHLYCFHTEIRTSMQDFLTRLSSHLGIFTFVSNCRSDLPLRGAGLFYSSLSWSSRWQDHHYMFECTGLNNVRALMQWRQMKVVANLERGRKSYRQRRRAPMASMMAVVGETAPTVVVQTGCERL